MAQTVRDVMTPNPVTLSTDSTITDAARAMREKDIGDVIVVDGDQVAGIVTDRDIVIRAIAEDRSPTDTSLGEIASQGLATVTPDDAADEAVKLMRERALRRIPVVDQGRPVGIVSLGDLAVERDPDSALADISAAEPNE